VLEEDRIRHLDVPCFLYEVGIAGYCRSVLIVVNIVPALWHNVNTLWKLVSLKSKAGRDAEGRAGGSGVKL